MTESKRPSQLEGDGAWGGQEIPAAVPCGPPRLRQTSGQKAEHQNLKKKVGPLLIEICIRTLLLSELF